MNHDIIVWYFCPHIDLNTHTQTDRQTCIWFLDCLNDCMNNLLCFCLVLKSVHSAGCTGLDELLGIEPAFAAFQETLFSQASLSLERSVQSKEVNQKLDKDISLFLTRLSPYLLLKPALKCLEWLVHRCRIFSFSIIWLLFFLMICWALSGLVCCWLSHVWIHI